MSAKKSSAFVQVKSSSNPTESTPLSTTPSTLSSSSSPDVGGGPLRIVSRNSSPSSQQPALSKPPSTSATPTTTTTMVSNTSSLPPPPPLHTHLPPPPLLPSFSHGSSMASMVGPSNIIIHSNNLNPFPFVPGSQYGLLASAMNSAGQPQTIIVNHCGQPVGFVSPNFYPQSPMATSSATSSSGGTPISTSASTLSRQPLLMACRPSLQQTAHSGGLPVGSSNMPLFPAYPTYAFPTFNNQSLLLPTGQILCRTPQGQLIGFQIPTNIAPQPIPVDAQQQALGGGKLQPVLPKPCSIFPVAGGGSSSRSASKISALNAPPQMTPLAATFTTAPVVCNSNSSSSTVVVKHDPETPSSQTSLMVDTSATISNGLPTATPANQQGLLQPMSLTGVLENNHTPITMPEVVVDVKNELTATEIHAMFVQEVENMPASDRPQVLTHFIDGFVIQESLEPFPLSPLIFDEFPMLIQPSTTTDWSAPPQLTPEERMTPPSAMLMPPDDCGVGGSSSSIHLCVRCAGEIEHSSRNDQYPNFCSKNCYKSYQLHRTNSDERSSSIKKSSSKGKSKQNKRAKLDETQMDIVPTTTPSNTSSPKRSTTDTPSELPSASNSFTLEEPSPPSVSDKIPAEWTVDDVQAWLMSLGAAVSQYAQIFRQQEIDGQALMLLQEDHLVRQMHVKLGPAVKICAALKHLRG